MPKRDYAGEYRSRVMQLVVGAVYTHASSGMERVIVAVSGDECHVQVGDIGNIVYNTANVLRFIKRGVWRLQDAATGLKYCTRCSHIVNSDLTPNGICMACGTYTGLIRLTRLAPDLRAKLLLAYREKGAGQRG